MAAIAFPIYHRIHVQYRAISQTHTNIKIQCSGPGLVRRDLNTAWPSVRLCPVCITMIIILNYHQPLIDHYRYHRRQLGQQHLQQQAQHHQQRRAATSAMLAQQRAAQFNMIIIRVARRWCCNRQRPCVRARQCERQSPCTAYGPCTCQCRENGCSPHLPMAARQCHRRQRHRENVNEWQFVQNGEESEDDDLD